MSTKDPNRPDGLKERLIRIETRLVKYQEQNVMQMDRLVRVTEHLLNILTEIVEAAKERDDAEEKAHRSDG